MHKELTNLLPHERMKAIHCDYFIRLGIVALIFLTALAIISALLLMPAYLYLTEKQNGKEADLVNIESVLSSPEEAALSTRLTALSQDASVLSALADAPSASDSIRSALAVPHSGITLYGFSYSPSADGSPRKLSITGSSATREALRNYQQLLSSVPFSRSADLPISAYAKNADIPFTIVVTLSP